MKAHCMRCGEQKEMKDEKLAKTKNGRSMMKGVCVDCGTKMCKFMPKDSSEEMKKAA